MQGKGLFFQSSTEIKLVIIKFCSFKHIHGPDSGSAISIVDGTPFNISIIDSIFISNSAQLGGAIYYQFLISILNISSCLFKNNSADINSGLGGAIYISSQSYIVAYYSVADDEETSSSAVVFNNIIFEQNHAQQGGVIYILISPLIKDVSNKFTVVPFTPFYPLKNVTFVDNYAQSGSVFKVSGPFSQYQVDTFLQPCFTNKNATVDYINNSAISTNSNPFIGSCSKGEYTVIPGNYCISCGEGTFAYQYNQIKCSTCPDNAECSGNYTGINGFKGYWTKQNYINCNNNSNCMVSCLDNPYVCIGDNKCHIGYIGPLCQVCNITQNYQRDGSYSCQECLLWKTILYFIIFSVIILVFCWLNIKSSYEFASTYLKQKVLKTAFDLPLTNKNHLSELTLIFLDYIQTLSLLMVIPIYQLQSIYNFFYSFGNPISSTSHSPLCIFDFQDGNQLRMTQYTLMIEYVEIVIYLGILFLIGYFVFYGRSKRDYNIINNDERGEYENETKTKIVQFQQSTAQKNQVLAIQSKRFKVKDFVTLLIISLISLYQENFPGVIIQSFSQVSCLWIGNLQRVVAANYAIECYSKEHNQLMYSGIPTLVVWVAVIPLMLFWIVRKAPDQSSTVTVLESQKNKDQTIVDLEFMRRYGILYYKYHNKWFTLKRIMVKIVLALVLIAFHFNIYLKGLLISAILVGYTLSNIRDPPFKNKQMNQIFIYSLFTQIATAVLVLVLYNTSLMVENSGTESQLFYSVITYLVLGVLVILQIVFFITMILLLAAEVSQSLKRFLAKMNDAPLIGRYFKTLSKVRLGITLKNAGEKEEEVGRITHLLAWKFLRRTKKFLKQKMEVIQHTKEDLYEETYFKSVKEDEQIHNLLLNREKAITQVEEQKNDTRLIIAEYEEMVVRQRLHTNNQAPPPNNFTSNQNSTSSLINYEGRIQGQQDSELRSGLLSNSNIGKEFKE